MASSLSLLVVAPDEAFHEDSKVRGELGGD